MHFWNRWRHKYLTDLREFHQTKVSKDPRPVQIGDVVAVYNESKRHGEWRFAVIESLIKGNDNVVKGANIRVIGKTLAYVQTRSEALPNRSANRNSTLSDTGKCKRGYKKP